MDYTSRSKCIYRIYIDLSSGAAILISISMCLRYSQEDIGEKFNDVLFSWTNQKLVATMRCFVAYGLILVWPWGRWWRHEPPLLPYLISYTGMLVNEGGGRQVGR